MRILIGLAAAALLSLAAGSVFAQAKTGYETFSFEEVTAKAEAGDAVAQHELGNRYYYKSDLKDDAKARAWFKKAAEQSDPYGEYEYATMCELGEGGPSDHETALKWYRKAADDDVKEAYADLGVMYEYGDVVTRDLGLAIAWYEKGVSVNERRAQALLGLLFRDGKGVAQDPVRAEDLLTKSAAQRWPDAADAMEAMYRNGIGVPADPVMAHAWRTVAYHLRNRKMVGNGYVMLSAPALNKEDNIRAWNLYRDKVETMGLIPDDQKIDENPAAAAATDFFKTNDPKDASSAEPRSATVRKGEF